MLTTILGAICALALNATPAASQADTLNVYMINGEKVGNFDGRQLVGKTISAYRISVSKDNSTGNVTKVHMINTTGSSAKAVAKSEPVYVVDGKATSQEEFNKLKPNDIAAMTILKAGSKAAAKYHGGKDKDVIIVDLLKK